MAISCSMLSKDQLALLPQGQARFKLQKPEAAKIESWTDQRLQNPQVVCVFLLLPSQTRKGLAGA